jgi:short-subunit dehydrogenase
VPVGVSDPHKALHLFDYELTTMPELQRCYALNCVVLAEMSRWFVTRSQNIVYRTSIRVPPRRAIINMSSMSALVSTYHLNVYGSGKKFVLEFSKLLAAELAPRNIDVIAATPAFVATRMTEYRKEKFDILPEECATGILSDLCLNRTETITHWKHWLAFTLLQRVVGSISTSAYDQTMQKDINKLVENIITKRAQ